MTSSGESTTTSFSTPETVSIDDYPKRRLLQNFYLVWVDSCFDEFSTDYQDAIRELQSIINIIYPYTSISSCIDFLTKANSESVFLIVSSCLSQQLIPFIHNISQLEAIYILGNETTVSEEWSKVKGIYSQITSIYDVLKKDVTQYNRNDISLSFVPSSDGITKTNLQQLDPSFMYTQIFKEILLNNEYNQEANKDLIAYWKEQYQGNLFVLKIIDEFERSYYDELSVWWYTRPCFIYEMLNRGLRNLEADTVIKMGFFIKDLHRHIERLHKERSITDKQDPFTVHRGQGLSESDFKKLMQTKGGLISFNNFLSTSIYRNFSFMFAESNSAKHDTIGILFKITVDPSISSSPFARIDKISYCSGEGEVLFSMHTIFRINKIKQSEENTLVWEVDLELTKDEDQQLSALTRQIRQETSGSTPHERLSKLLCKIGQFKKAEELYLALLDQTSDMDKKANFYQQIGDIKYSQRAYTDAIVFYEKSLEIKSKILPPDDPQLAATYIHISAAYMKVENFKKAAWYSNRGTEILRRNIPSNHPDLIISYIDTGRTYSQGGEHLGALLLQEKALENSQKTLSTNHPHLGASYNNIGIVYHNIGEYVKALSYYEKALEIFQKTLPSNHPSLASSYNNIGAVYKYLGDYPKALSFHEKSLDIRQRTLPSNHPDLAISYNNIGMVYDCMGEYSKALSFHEKSLDIRQRTLPSNHPELKAIREYIETIKTKSHTVVHE